MAQRDTIQTRGLVDRVRLQGVVECLRDAGDRGLTRMELAAKEGLSLRSVDRAFRLLEAQGAKLERRPGREAGGNRVVLAKGPTWDEHVTPQVRLALRLAAISLSRSGTQVWQEKLDALELIVESRMSHRDRRLFARLSGMVGIQGGPIEDPIEDPDVLEPLLRAMDARREVRLAYRAVGAPAATERVVVPYALTHDLFSGGTFLLVWDGTKRAPLHLRLNRIESLKVAAAPGHIPDPDLMARTAQFQIGGWASTEPPFIIEARVFGAHWIQSFKEAPPALPDFESDPFPDGDSALVRFRASHEYGARRWLLQFGAFAEVLRPDWLRENMKAQHREALALYRKPERTDQA